VQFGEGASIHLLSAQSGVVVTGTSLLHAMNHSRRDFHILKANYSASWCQEVDHHDQSGFAGTPETDTGGLRYADEKDKWTIHRDVLQ
jgi:hypothetical protein